MSLRSRETKKPSGCEAKFIDASGSRVPRSVLMTAIAPEPYAGDWLGLALSIGEDVAR